MTAKWKRFINMSYLCRPQAANSFHPTIKFAAEIWEAETTFLDTKVYKGVRFNKVSILDERTHLKASETFQYTNFYSCHPPTVTKGFFKGEASSLLSTNSSQFSFEENMGNFKTHPQNRDYRARIVEKHLSEIKFFDREIRKTRQHVRKYCPL